MDKRTFIYQHWIFLFLLLTGLIVRLVFINYHGFSNDELSAWYRTNYTNFNDLINLGVKTGDMHPAFYQVLLWYWVRLFGDTEFSIRFISLIFYLANSWLIYRIGIRFFHKNASLIFLAIYSGLTFTIINTTFSRPYNSGTYFLLLAFWGILNLKICKEKQWKWTLLTSIGFLGAMYSHYFAFLTAGFIGVCGIFYLSNTERKWLFISGIIAVVGFIPHFFITNYQLHVGGLTWLNAPTIFWPIDFIYLFFNESWWLVFVLITMYSIFLKYYGFKRLNKQKYFSLAIFCLTFFSAFLLSYTFTPIMRDLAMLFILPFAFLPILSSIDFKDRQVPTYVVCIGLVMLTIFDSFGRNDILGFRHFGVFKQVGEEINFAVQKYSRDSITFASNYNNVEYINYYLDSKLTESIIDWEKPEAMKDLYSRIANSRTPYFIYSVNNKFHSPMFIEIIKKKYPIVRDYKIFGNSQFYFFSIAGRSKQENKWIRNLKTELTESHLEFLNAHTFKVSDFPQINASKGAYFVVSCKVNKGDLAELYLVVSLERNGKILLNGKDPFLYVAYNQIGINDKSNLINCVTAFQIPEIAQSNDTIKMYLWNPKKGTVKFQDFILSANELN
jgi:hypothetical protein